MKLNLDELKPVEIPSLEKGSRSIHLAVGIESQESQFATFNKEEAEIVARHSNKYFLIDDERGRLATLLLRLKARWVPFRIKEGEYSVLWVDVKWYNLADIITLWLFPSRAI